MYTYQWNGKFICCFFQIVDSQMLQELSSESEKYCKRLSFHSDKRIIGLTVSVYAFRNQLKKFQTSGVEY